MAAWAVVLAFLLYPAIIQSSLFNEAAGIVID